MKLFSFANPVSSSTLLRRLVAAGLAFALAAMAAWGAEGPQLRLVAEAGGQTFEQFTVESNRIVIQELYRTRPIPAGAAWRLDGDLHEQRQLLLFSPGCSLERVDMPDWERARGEYT